MALYNHDIERLVLGSAVSYKQGLLKVTSELSEDDFDDAKLRRIFTVMTEMLLAGKPIDVPLLAEELISRKELDKVGGYPAITALTHEAPTGDSQYLAPYIDRLKHYTYRRKVMDALGILRSKTLDMGTDDDVIESLYQAVSSWQGTQVEFTQRRLRSMKDVVMDVYAEINEQLENPESAVNGIKTGLADVDKRIGSMKPGQLVVIAGRPGNGKSTLALTIAVNAAVAGKKIMYHTMEMQDTETVKRAWARASWLDGQKIYNPALMESKDWDKLIKSAEPLSKLPIYWDDATSLSPADVRRKVQEFKRIVGCMPDMIIIDYLQLMEAGTANYKQNRTQEVTYITRQLKNMAGEFFCPIVLLSQLNRDNERQNRPPRLPDLRDSGSIEQDANIVILIHRNSRLSGDNKRIEYLSTATLNVAKCRNGSPGETQATFLPEYFVFQDYTDRTD